MTYWVYILQCSDGTFYTGITNNLEKRLLVHNAGKGAKYTRGRGPVTLMFKEEFSDKGSALKKEIEIKRLNKDQKKSLFNQ